MPSYLLYSQWLLASCLPWRQKSIFDLLYKKAKHHISFKLDHRKMKRPQQLNSLLWHGATYPHTTARMISTESYSSFFPNKCPAIHINFCLLHAHSLVKIYFRHDLVWFRKTKNVSIPFGVGKCTGKWAHLYMYTIMTWQLFTFETCSSCYTDQQ